MTNQSENINELASALAKCQGELQPAIKDSKNPFFKSKYADLNSVWSVCREPLSKYGLSVIQTMDKEDGALILITTLAHSSGQWIRSRTPIPLLKQDPQAMGSSITYIRRYSLSAIVGVSTDEDDDGEKAMNRNSKKNEVVQEEIEETEEYFIKQIESFCAQYPDQNEEWIKEFFLLLKTSWSKPMKYILDKYRNHEKFLEDFLKWIEKTKK